MVFTYLGRPLDKSDDICLAVHRNIQKVRQVWGRLGKLPRREGADPFVSAIFYRAVVQKILLFGSETWVLLEEMAKRLEGVHVSFLRKVTGNTARRQCYGTCNREGEVFDKCYQGNRDADCGEVYRQSEDHSSRVGGIAANI